ncbi:SCO4225 family membrane protein [Streptomyces sp. NPDC059072]|uniref:SCO4225 family membrane protein n=1 Tax=Streptomyces sp. NPDC059072 TaxID=3346715 RepID=UPI003681773C
MERRRSKLELWVPGGYLAVVLGLQVWVEVLSRTGDAGFAGMWPLLATAPFSLLPLFVSMPGAGDPLEQTPVPVPMGSRPPEPLPVDPAAPPLPPTDWQADQPVGLDPWAGFGFYGALLFGALVNAGLLWALVRVIVRRRQAA